MTTYTPIARLPVMQPGDPAVRNNWGNILDAAMPLIEQMALGNAPIVLTGTTGAYTLTLANDASDQARLGFYNFQGTLTANTTVTIPPIARVGWVGNNTTGGFNVILTTGNGTTMTIAPGFAYLWTCDGTNVSAVSIGTTGTITAANGLVLGNAAFIGGKDSSGVPFPMLGFGADNWVTMFTQGFGWRILDGIGSQTFVSVGVGGAVNVAASLSVGGAINTGGELEVAGQATVQQLTVNGASTLHSLVITDTLHVGGVANVGGSVAAGTAAGGGGYLGKAGSTGSFGASVFNLLWDGTGMVLYHDATNLGYITTASDARFKTVVAPMADGALDRIGLIEPLVYRWKNKGIFRNDGKDHEGLLAQSLLPIIPSAVEGDPDGEDPISINTMPLIATLIKAVQELTARVMTLEAKC